MGEETNPPALADVKTVKATARPVPAKKTWFIPVFWAGPNKVCAGQPTANWDKAVGLLRGLTGDRANALVVSVELPEFQVGAPASPESQ